MKNNRIKVFITVIFAVFSCGISYPSQCYMDKPRNFQLEYSLKAINTGKKGLKNLTVVMPLITDNLPNQKVEILKIFPEDYKITGGNRLIFKVKEIKAGQGLVFKVKCKATVYHVFYDTNFEEIKKIATNKRNDIFLKPQKYIESDSELVKKKAKALKSKDGNPYLTALNIYDFMRENLNFDFRAKPAGAEKSLENNLAACSDSAALYAALCRASGIPARYAGGLFLGNMDFENKPADTVHDMHAWDLLNFDGKNWMPVDPTQGRFNQIRRFSCFAQQDNCYITVWKDEIIPFNASIRGNKNAENIQTVFSAVIQEEKRKNNPANAPQELIKTNSAGGTFNQRDNKYSINASNASNALGYRYLQSMGYSKAAYCFTKAIALNNKNVRPYENMINLCIYIKYYGSALDGINRAKKEFPNCGKFFEQEGELYLTLGNARNALAPLKKAASLGGKNPYCSYLLGIAYLNMKDKNTAEKYFNKAENTGADPVTKDNIKRIREKFFTR